MYSNFLPSDIAHRIHIWTVSVGSAAAAGHLEQVLDESEKLRAQRFGFRHLRDRFIAIRGTLRYLLAYYIGADPCKIRLDYGPNGKPVIESNCDIQFNVSHSKDFAVVAIAAQCPVGIDIEYMCELPEMEDLAGCFFRPAELAEIGSRPPTKRRAAFFNIWTRKEAYAKALGTGFTVPIENFSVADSETPGQYTGHEQTAKESWVMEDLDLAPDYAAALAYRGRKRPLSHFSISNVAELESKLWNCSACGIDWPFAA